MNKINFYLPGFYYKYELSIKLITLLKEHPEYFYDNIRVGAVYDTFPGAIWNGGRTSYGTTDIENIRQTIKNFNDLGVPVRFTFTNCLIEEKHTHDTYCNLIMESANNGMNEVLVNSQCLEEYLRKKYPKFKFISSTTKCERNIESINAACEKYDLVVPDYRDCIHQSFLEGLNHKDKIEILINARCNPECKRRAEHYRFLSESQINFDKSKEFRCPDERRSFLEALNMYSTVMKFEDIVRLVDMGFSHFKIEGRNNHKADVIESYVYYMVKPEYKDLVRYMLIEYCWY